MIISKSDIVGKIRTAIDDIVPTAQDSFTADTDSELWQATKHAVEQLLLELPVELLEPQPQDSPSATAGSDGQGTIRLADDYLRFIALKLTTWRSPVYVLLEQGSEEEIRQRTSWGRGTPEKPRAMQDSDAEGHLILRYWTAGKSGDSYDHSIELLNYIPIPAITSSQITCALRPVAEKAVIYRAASIFFEGKKEADTAEKFRNL